MPTRLSSSGRWGAMTLLGLSLAGCWQPRQPGEPIRLDLLPYAGPPPGARGDFVTSYSPWYRTDVGQVRARGGTTVAKMLDGVVVRCRNVKCSYDAKGHGLFVESPPLDLAHLDVTMQKEGFEPLEIRIPVSNETPDPAVFVVMTPSVAK